MSLGTEAPGYEAMLGRFVAWAEQEPDIRAVVVVGSRANHLRPADKWSDVDLVLAVRDPKVYLGQARWLRTLGDAKLTCVATLEGQTFRAAWFEGEAKFDFIIVASASMRTAGFLIRLATRFPALRRILPRAIREQLATFSDTIAKGMRVLVDKDRWVSRLARTPIQRSVRSAPPGQEFSEAINTFWSWALWTAKILERGELWRAKRSCDHEMKEMLLQMLEWHAGARNGWNRETWYLGRFLEEWVDPRVKEALGEIFARYEEVELWQALIKTCELYRWVSQETAERLRLPYPTNHERWAWEHVQTHAAGSKARRRSER